MKAAAVDLGCVGTVTAACVASHRRNVEGVNISTAKTDKIHVEKLLRHGRTSCTVGFISR
jgi:UDP-glucose 6-dehydrogenase